MRLPRVCGRLDHGGGEHALDAIHGVRRSLCSIHDEHHARDSRGNEGGKDDVEHEIRQKRRHILFARHNDEHRGHKEDGRPRDRREQKRLGVFASADGMFGRKPSEIDDGVVKRPERIHRLLKHFHNGNAAHVFGARFVHPHQRALVLHHEIHAAALHHPGHSAESDYDR